MSLLKLQQMIDSGETYYYRNQPTIIKSFDNTHGEIEILVEINGKPQKFIKEDEMKLDLFLCNFSEVSVVDDESKETNLPVHPNLYHETKTQFSTLTNMLMSDIEKVRADPKYVPQAKQVCNNVSAIVNITKLQLQLFKKG